MTCCKITTLDGGTRGGATRLAPLTDHPNPVPRYGHFVDAFPLSVAGKFGKEEMREEAMERAAAVVTA